MSTLRALIEVLSPALRSVGGVERLDAEVDEVVLIGPGDRLPTSPTALVLCVDASTALDLRGPVPGVVVKLGPLEEQPFTRASIPVIVADDDLPWNHLLQLLTSALGPREGSGDLFALANSLAAAVGGAVTIEDPQRRVLAYSSLPDQPIDEARRQGILGRKVPEFDRNDRIYREVQRSHGVVRIPAEGEILPRLAVGVRSGAELLGSLWVVEHELLPEGSERALLDASRLASLHLLRARVSTGTDRRARGELLRALLDGRSSPELAGARLSIDPVGPVTLLAFAFPDDTALDELDADAVADLVQLQCAAVSARCSVLLQLGTVYVLLPSADLPRARMVKLAQSVLERAQAALRVQLCAGIGCTAGSLTSVGRSRADADAVVRLIRPGQVATVEDVLPQVALLDLQGHLAASPHLRLPAVDLLLRHDSEHATPYVESVLAYLSANADMPAAAEAVQVHPNTFRYRMRRVRELFDLDLEDPDVRLVVWLQLRTLT
jgi:DNA-binding PucR family transcriptional regulator